MSPKNAGQTPDALVHQLRPALWDREGIASLNLLYCTQVSNASHVSFWNIFAGFPEISRINLIP
jgi:hypothetical protein